MTVTATRDDAVAAYGAAQRRAAIQASIQIQRLWREIAANDLTGSWTSGLGRAVVQAVRAGQWLAASTGQAYVDQVVAADGLKSDYTPGATTVPAAAFTQSAADGRPLESLLYLPVIRTKTLLAGGMTIRESLAAGLMDLQRMTVSEIADAGSGAAGVAMVANRTVTGYVRQVRSGACSRCIILAGRWYRYDAGFARHKRCQCYGIPATAANPGKHLNPMSFFNQLSRAEQDRRFGTADAAAIREGADIFQIVNAHRSVRTLDSYGRRVVATLEGTTRHGGFYGDMRREAEQRLGTRFARSAGDVEMGLPRFQLRTPRLMPSEIYKLAEDRVQLIRLLKRFGFLL